ncbi:MAG TPA: DMT family transporter [Herbaspirillum sp.]|uniref:DMT family transporter n=1 Tax=Herbaspirillum sp. TaxID=1890675 RepID=UPI002D47E82E|nr:DMT family transporter [Herbaspirillum sp.]HZG19738.1 DMT family transporter [Herbaspirillum sp.]
MNTLLLFFNALLVGLGSSMVLSQNAEVTPVIGVGHRMLGAGVILLLIAWGSGKRLRLARHHMVWVAMQGIAMFGLAYVAFYNAVLHIPSGLVALVLSVSPMITAFLSRLLTGDIPTTTDKIGMGCGVLGICIVFGGGMGPLIFNQSYRHELTLGLAWALMAAFSTAAGTAIGARNRIHGIWGVATVGWGLLFSGVVCLAVAALEGSAIVSRYSDSYLAGLAYLVVAGSVAAFLLYFELIKRTGPARASFSFVLVPVVAICMSVIREGVVVTLPLFAGTSIALLGNIVVLRQSSKSPGSGG